MDDDETNQDDAPKDFVTPEAKAKFFASIRKAYESARPASYFRQWPLEYLLEAGLPKEFLETLGKLKTSWPSSVPGKFPAEVNQTEMAEIISNHFNITVDKTALGKLKDKPWIEPCWNGGQHGNQRWKPEITLRLWAENMGDKNDNATEADDRRAIVAMERESKAITLAKLKRIEDARWMITDAHDFWLEGVVTRARQSAISMLKRVADLAKQAAKESGADEAMTEKLIAALRPKLDDDFESWQSDFTKQVEELDVAAHEFSETKKAELKVKKL